jgi:hypothetical protein
MSGSRSATQITGDIQASEECLRILIDQVIMRNLRPDRSWRGACESEYRRLDNLRAELQAANLPSPSLTPNATPERGETT